MKLPNFFLFALLFCGTIFSQEKEAKHFFLEGDYFYGSIVEHNTALSHLMIGHQEGFTFSFIQKPLV